MRTEDIERVFGHGRLKMATGEHVEVFREEVLPGERRRYTKRFLTTGDADFREWTAREWRMLARLIGHGVRCVPDVVRFDGAPEGGMRQVQTYDAGPTVEQWATLLPVARGGIVLRHVFEDCAHWFALAHHCLAALDDVHALQLVHLDIKADNLCVPYRPASFDPHASDALLAPDFARLALIDFAFSLVSHETLASALPIGWQKDYDYQSPRLLRALEAGREGDLGPTEQLDWRCDLYSLAAMLKRYLPDDASAEDADGASGWNRQRNDDARALIFALREAHDADLPSVRPHRELLALTARHLSDPELADSLERGWTIAHDAAFSSVTLPATPMTRIVRARPVPHAPISVTWGASPPDVPAPPPLPPEAIDDATSSLAGPAASLSVPAVVRNPRSRRVVAETAPAETVTDAPAKPRRGDAWRTVAAVCALGSLTAAAPLLVGDAQDHAPTAASALPTGDRGTPQAALASSAPASSTQPTANGSAEEASGPVASEALPRPADTTASTEAPSTTHAEPSRIRPAERTAPAPDVAEAASRPSGERGAAKVKPRAAGNSASARSPSRASASLAQARKSAQDVVSSSQRQRDARATAERSLAFMAERTSRPVAPPRTSSTAAPSADRAPAASMSDGARGPNANPALASVAPTAQAEPPSASAAASGSIAQEPQPPHIAEPPAASAAAAEAASTLTPTPPSGSRASTSRPAQDPLAEAAKGLADALRSGLRQLFHVGRPAAQPPAPVQERNALALPSSPVPMPSSPPPPASTYPRAASLASAPIEIASDGTALSAIAPPPSVRFVPSDRIAYPPPSAFSGVTRTRIAPPEPVSVDALRLISEVVPTVASQARADAADALWMAALADRPSQNRAVFEAVDAHWPSERIRVAARNESARARTMHEEARRTFESGRARDALGMEMHAFASDPRDPDIAGFLAYLHLQTTPVQPETARQLALHALAISGAQRARRIDDWNTFAVASALTGREVDATRAFLVQVALTPDLDRTCRAAQRALAIHGERLRAPLQAMLDRVRAQRRDEDSPSCAWPSYPMTARWQ